MSKAHPALLSYGEMEIEPRNNDDAAGLPDFGFSPLLASSYLLAVVFPCFPVKVS
jgi:hypothetical protein